MKKALKLFGIIVRLVFESTFTYLMFAMLTMGFDKVLWVGVVAGLIGITFGMVEFFAIMIESEVEKNIAPDPGSEQEPPLYYRIKQIADGYYFEVYAQNHEFICESDIFKTLDGATTGLWYLMDSMKKMNELSWEVKNFD